MNAEPTGSQVPVDGASASSPRVVRAELLATIVLSAATVLTAWSAFQNIKWNSVQADRTSQATANRTESVRAFTQAGQQSAVDTSVFTAWLTATDEGQTRLADQLAAHFRPEFTAAFDAWLATSPLTDSNAPSSPFAMPSYHLASEDRAAALDAMAAAEASGASTAGTRADDYALMTVLAATVLFFGALSIRFQASRVQLPLLTVAAGVFIGTLSVTASYPVKL